MSVAGFLLMPAGWVIVLAAVALLPRGPSLVAFVFAGLGVEAMGLAVAVRSLAAPRGDQK